MNLNLNRENPLQQRNFDKIFKKSGGIRNSVPESEGKKDTSVAKKQLAKSLN